MEVKTINTMTPDPKMEQYEAQWKQAEKILIRGMITKEAAEYLEEMAFNDFGMLKKGAIGMELSKLITEHKEHYKKK